MDCWYNWFVSERYGKNEESKKYLDSNLAEIRDFLLSQVNLKDCSSLLDIGCGNGLIGIQALLELDTHGTVTFLDQSQSAIDLCRESVEKIGLIHRAKFITTSADRMLGIQTGSIDLVLSRAALMYVENKQSVFDECYRILSDNGRLVFFEPINRFSASMSEENKFRGFTFNNALEELAIIKKYIATETDTIKKVLCGFDERSLYQNAVSSGFDEVQINLMANRVPGYTTDMKTFMTIRANPFSPSLSEAIKKTLNDNQKNEFLKEVQLVLQSQRPKSDSAYCLINCKK